MPDLIRARHIPCRTDRADPIRRLTRGGERGMRIQSPVQATSAHQRTEDRERQRRETEHHDWPELRIELPVHGYDEPSRRRPTPSAPIVIDVFGGA